MHAQLPCNNLPFRQVTQRLCFLNWILNLFLRAIDTRLRTRNRCARKFKRSGIKSRVYIKVRGESASWIHARKGNLVNIPAPFEIRLNDHNI